MRLVGFVHFLQEQVNEFFERCFPEFGFDYDPTGKHKELTDIAANFRHFWVMVDDEQEIIGTIAITDLEYIPQYGNVLHRNAGKVVSLYLLKEFQGQGYGEKMFQFALDQASSFGYTWLYLDSTASIDDGVMDLYKRHGFVETGRYNNNPEATFFMRKQL